MRVFLLLMIAACFLGCKKSEPITPGLFGKWELRKQTGGIAGIDSSYKAGNGDIIQFNSDSTFKHYIKGKLDLQGIFHYKKNGYVLGQAVYDELDFNDSGFPNAVTVNGDKMTIGLDFDDGIAAQYQKIAN
jgi:hypothetical protein